MSTIYSNKKFYVDLMHDFVEEKIDGISFSNRFLSQRSIDIDLDRNQTQGGHMVEKSEESTRDRNEYLRLSARLSVFSPYFDSKIDWCAYVATAKQYHITGKNFFLPIFHRIQEVDIEDFKEYFYAKKYRCVRKNIAKDRRVDEKELRRRIKEKLDLLEANKGKW